MIDYLNPSRISANPPEGTEPFCVEICTTNCKKTSLRGEKVRKSAEIIQGRQTMADMSNEQAAEILERLAYDDSDKRNDYAVAMAISALRSGWVKTADRLPEPWFTVLMWDGDEMVTGYLTDDGHLIEHRWVQVFPATHWMTPEPPKEGRQ